MAQLTNRHPHANFITSVPSGSSESGTIDLPAGHYWLYVAGTQTAATTDPTLLLEAYVDEGQTSATVIPGGLTTDTGATTAVIDLEVAQSALLANFSAFASTLGVRTPVYVPYGIKYTYTKNGGTAVDLTLIAVPVGD